MRRVYACYCSNNIVLEMQNLFQVDDILSLDIDTFSKKQFLVYHVSLNCLLTHMEAILEISPLTKYRTYSSMGDCRRLLLLICVLLSPCMCDIFFQLITNSSTAKPAKLKRGTDEYSSC